MKRIIHWLARGLAGGLAGAALLAAASGPAAAQSVPCPDNLRNWSALKNGDSLTCVCDTRQRRGGSVWGGPRYTTDSSICRAAVHAGVIPSSGGTVTVYKAAGCPLFNGSSSNGVTAGKWGPYASTFAFANPAPSCDQPLAQGPAQPCPRSMTAYRGMPPGQVLRCSCAPAQFGGSVWGSGRYTADSSVCGAALHAGAIPATGGTVTVRTAPGCGGFVGTASNGITTKNWGSYNRTFSFADQPPACAR